MKLIRKFKLGHLFFKFIQGTTLEAGPFNTSKLLADEMYRLKMIELYREGLNKDLETVDKAKEAVWYSYKTGMEPTKLELVKFLSKGEVA